MKNENIMKGKILSANDVIKDDDRIYSCKSDSMFKSVVACEKGKSILKAVIEDALKIDVGNIILLNSEFEKEHISEKGRVVDCLVISGDDLINIEINRNATQAIRDRNFRYITSMHNRQYKIGDSYYTSKRSIQINLDWNVNYKKIKKVYKMLEVDDSSDIFTDKTEIY